MNKETPEQEAERLYPDSKMPVADAAELHTHNEMQDAQRSAHITAARMYMGEIDKYKKLLEYSHKAKMRIDIPNVTDDELAANWNYFLTQNGLK